MAIDTNQVMADARCIDSCIPDGMKTAVLIYLLAKSAGVDVTDTNALINNARCLDSCIPDGAKASVILYLFDKMVNG